VTAFTLEQPLDILMLMLCSILALTHWIKLI